MLRPLALCCEQLSSLMPYIPARRNITSHDRSYRPPRIKPRGDRTTSSFFAGLRSRQTTLVAPAASYISKRATSTENLQKKNISLRIWIRVIRYDVLLQVNPGFRRFCHFSRHSDLESCRAWLVLALHMATPLTRIALLLARIVQGRTTTLSTGIRRHSERTLRSL